MKYYYTRFIGPGSVSCLQNQKGSPEKVGDRLTGFKTTAHRWQVSLLKDCRRWSYVVKMNLFIYLFEVVKVGGCKVNIRGMLKIIDGSLSMPKESSDL